MFIFTFSSQSERDLLVHTWIRINQKKIRPLEVFDGLYYRAIQGWAARTKIFHRLS